MIGPVVTRGLTFAVKYVVTAGFLSGAEAAPPESAHSIFRVNQTGAGGDLVRPSQSPTGSRVFKQTLFDDMPGFFDGAGGDFEGGGRPSLFRREN